MINSNLKDINKINGIIKRTIKEIDSSRSQILNIVDNARAEYEFIKSELSTIREQISQVIDEVDVLEIKNKKMRQRLAHVSKNFKTFTEEDIKAAYDKASDLKVAYLTKQNEEKSLRSKRTQLEIALKKALNTIKSAENVINQIGIASGFLKGEVLTAIDDMDKSSEMFIGVKILEAQENERKRISRDIHDGPAQHIANIIMKADICERMIQYDVKEGLNELADLKSAVKVALKEVRGIIYDLRPMSLDDLGLNKTIEEHVKTFSREAYIDTDIRLGSIQTEVESIIQIAVYRIVQEILNNIKKHAQANYVEVKLDYGSKYLRLVVTDNGIGFDVDETLNRVKTRGESYGLLGILDRVNQLQGEIKIKSSNRLGTEYIVKLPVNREVIKDEKWGN
ncbi:sensor histidine kinase [Vallitalea okinawensis]|uniref:sensor histidine kinase n=1 Tax=Vallitalea okinawensis TaxID=2078660 RepID=UPI000CFBF949|nr:sensor histidine kinase [Vallitalea okinawensis]